MSRSIHLRAATVDTRTLPNLAEEVPAAFAPNRAYVIQLDGPLTPQRRAKLSRVGVHLGDYLPDHAYIVRLAKASPRALAALGLVEWIGEYREAWKIDPQIGKRLVAFQTPRRLRYEATGKVQLVVSLFEGEDLGAAREAISLAGGEVLGGTTAGRQGLVDVVIDADRVANLAALESVQFIEEAPEVVMRNDTTYWILQSDLNGQAPVWDQGLHGEGQTGGIIDGPMQESHCSFDDSVAPGPSHRKIVYYDGPIGADSHGTHVAGTMAGDQAPYGVASFRDGMAFAAKLTFIPVTPIYSNPSTFINRLEDAHNNGARVHSNSWGDDGTTSYTTWCRQIDLFSRDYEESLVAFAVTNTSTLKTPENAKNVLAVGATWDAPGENNHCTGGVGPTADGRRKPEIYAPGCGTQSSSANTTCDWRAMSGTSMACPAISGMALLVRQYYTEGFYPSGQATPQDGFTPTGALLRATLLNAAVDMTGVYGYPSNLEGWGRLLLDKALCFPGDARKLYVQDVRNADGLSTGQQTVYYVVVVDQSVPLRVTLVWTDVPAAVGSSIPAINNLDLQVEAPDGTIYRGNNFNPATGESFAGGSFDALNNVEQVHRLVPAFGGYNIIVMGTAVNQSTQGYALVVTGGIDLTLPDCNGNGTPDDQDIAQGTSTDCNNNTIPDECDLAQGGGSADCNQNGLPDECETDCNYNDVPDDCDIAGGTSIDANGNGVPDECEVPRGNGDCDQTGVIDLNDFATFAVCFTGSGGTRAPGCLCADLDGDGDVDLNDFAVFADRFGMPVK